MPPPQQDASGNLEEAIAAVIEAAESAGFQMPEGGVSQDQLPMIYQQLLAAAAQSQLARTPFGQQAIQMVAQALGMGGGGMEGQTPGRSEAPLRQGQAGPMPPEASGY